MKELTKQEKVGLGLGLVASVVIAGTGVGFMLSGGDHTATSKDSVSTAPSKASTFSGSVLTGKPGTAGSVMAVKIDNVGPARPATNLQDADIVYGIQVEGGLSRLMAIFDSSHLPSHVGPVRSARETDLTLLPEYGNVGFAYSGATSKIVSALNHGPWKNITPGQFGDFYRNSSRYAPHNEYVRTPPQLLNGVPKAKDIGLRFGSLPSGGSSGTSVSASMPAASFQFHWNGHRYDVYMDHGRSPWTTDNVIVQDVSVRTIRHSHSGAVPFSNTVGHGNASIYRDGKAFHVKWNRPNKHSGTHYTLNGKDFALKPGQTWIVLN